MSEQAPTQLQENAAPTETPAPHTTDGANEPSWYIDDKTPGDGERPSWMPAKYKSMADLGKSYTELEKKLGAFTGAPESYNFEEVGLDDSQLMVQEIASVGKELNMSQEGINKLLGRICQANETESNMHLEAEAKSLGEDGERMLNEYQNWTKDFFRPEQAEVIKGWIKSADDLKTFNHLMAHSNKSAVPTGNDLVRNNRHENVASLRAEMAESIAKFDSDPAYRKNWNSRLAGALEREKG
tara:strand:- start:248 stop:970 length:723 start_codon:yes stop_codon:yes gene_type:complete